MKVLGALQAGTKIQSREYLEYAVMKHMGWSYSDLLECPDATFNDIVRFMNTEAAFVKSKE